MNVKNAMEQHLKTVLKDRNIKPCLSLKDSSIFYIDDSTEQKKCIILDEVENASEFLKIINPNKKTLFLLAVDGCFFGDGKPPKRCDCIFFDDIIFCFAELKFKSFTEHLDNIENNRKDAITQLLLTIDFFDKRLNNNYLNFNKEAYVCTPVHYPNKNTALDAFAIQFSDLGITLIESNEKTF